eukprot:CAMPEP_0178413110 /NCGR_PEP_ID=MMETSP0689_2-20121128/22360_1 /TAXON_ID=160604 /ORGANISM="Amphidinium massartii, Strain CS-259" /LENGTH=539 /DNA_ID=CAMNT_0020034375 /DNA_START=34 /DNA_END=1650 /DNA_ORIENTATION=-
MGKAEQAAELTIAQRGFSPGMEATLSEAARKRLKAKGGGHCKILRWDDESMQWHIQLTGARGQTARHCVDAANLSPRKASSSSSAQPRDTDMDQEEVQHHVGRDAERELEEGDSVNAFVDSRWQPGVVVGMNKSKVIVILLEDTEEREVPRRHVSVREDSKVLKRRREANKLAEEMLLGAEVSDSDILQLLRAWAWEENPVRKNVIPEGKTFVYSDTFGLVYSRQGYGVATTLTEKFPSVMQVLSRWMVESRGSKAEHVFPFTSINVNFNYAARRHRDGRNEGPSLIRALGDFTGGRLQYWPSDNRSGNVDSLHDSDKVVLDAKANWQIFDGNRAHSVEDYEGERYSIVFYSCSIYRKKSAVSDTLRDSLKGCGAIWPTEATLNFYKKVAVDRWGASASQTVRQRIYAKRPATEEEKQSVLDLDLPTRTRSQVVQRSTKKTQSGATTLRRSQQKQAVLRKPASPGEVRKVLKKPSAPQLPYRKPSAALVKYKVVDWPHLALKLTMGHVYSNIALIRRCKGDRKKIEALRTRLKDPAVFK